ncbi:hypothetical protein L6164_019935 [Bauhinia variegata]|uniref:Uncharacterized protein n=1 Tax=Bauhinia variegata TaxID=167791 RepID=A0ACB9MUA0_BAUVA|nr:hypothetical protein L6164_019935 [Bauhinia variegata]
MEPPPEQSIEISSKSGYQAEEDPRDKVIDDCCSCWYNFTDTCFDYLCCNLC